MIDEKGPVKLQPVHNVPAELGVWDSVMVWSQTLHTRVWVDEL